jgi:hypothetical protein
MIAHQLPWRWSPQSLHTVDTAESSGYSLRRAMAIC